MQWLQK